MSEPTLLSTPFWTGTDGSTVPVRLLGGDVCIGNFDGLHRGHRAVIARTRDAAHAADRPALALTFEPHPRSFFRPEQPLFRLTPPAVKLALLERAGLDGALVLTFGRALAEVEAEDFIKSLIVERLQARRVVVGHDFHFGRRRGGSPALLREAGARWGFETVIVSPVGGDAPVSATAIREALGRGDVAAANRLLGYRWFVEAIVQHGDKRGRELGFPTANLRLDPACGLAHGIYAVRAAVEGRAGVIGGVASFGRRPTFDDGPPLLEVYLFDFSGDLYGCRLQVEFLGRLRGEQRFESAETLVAQMHRDAEEARQILARGDDLPSMIGRSS